MSEKPTYEELEQRVKTLEKEALQLKRATDNLLESEQDKYAKLIQDSSDAIIIAQGVELKLANKAAYKMWGYQNEKEAAGLTMTDVISPKDIEMMTKRSQDREMGKNVPSRYEFRALRKDGTEFLAELSVSRIIYQGQVARQGVVKDITKQRQAEETIRESREKYKLLADNVTDIICVVNLEKLQFEYVSPSINFILGYTVEEFMGFNIFDLLLPYSADIVAETISQELDKNNYGKAEPQMLELDIVRKDGLEICLGVSARFLRDNEGQVTSILCVARDISEKKKAEMALQESEERYRFLANNVTDMIWTMDMNFNYTYVSPSITRMLGFTVEEGLARTVEESITPASFNNAMKVLAQELELNAKGQAPLDRSIKIENELFCKDGSTVWTEAQVSFMYDSKGQPKGIIGATRDISERKKAEKKLKKINEWLEEKVEERTAEIQEKNVALKVLLEQRENDKKNLEESIMSNVKELLIPNINRLKSVKLSSKQQTSVKVLESNLNEICSPFANKASSSYMKLTPTEIQIVNFIKHGMSSKDIAESLSLSQRTVDSHRYNIRKKLGVSGKGVNLRTYLLSLS